MDELVFNVAQLLKAPIGSSIAVDFHEDDTQLDEDIKTVGPLDGHARLRRTNQGLLVDGWVDLTLELTCDRCLNEFKQPMHVTFEEQFYPTVDVVSGIPLAPFDQEEIFPINDHHEIDLTEAIRQTVLTALPMTKRCRADCKGLCPQCGHDLNLGPCECKPEVDSRWNVLEQLLQNELPSEPNTL